MSTRKKIIDAVHSEVTSKEGKVLLGGDKTSRLRRLRTAYWNFNDS